MGLPVYETKRFREVAADLRRLVEPVKEDLKSRSAQLASGSIPGFQPVGYHYYRKRLPHGYRLLARSWLLNDIGAVVICFVDLMRRDDPSYAVHAASFRDSYDAELRAEQQAIRACLGNLTEPPPPPLPEPPEHLLRWMQPLEKPDHSWQVYECFDWPKRMRDLADIYVGAVHQAVYELVCATQPPEAERIFVKQVAGAPFEIWYAYWDDQLVLLHLANKGSDTLEAEWNRVENGWQDFLERYHKASGLGDRALRERECHDALAQLTRRCYPATVVDNRELWNELERSGIAPPGMAVASGHIELALSFEELEVLGTLVSGQALPLLLEGRAGSGKSTTLCYHTAGVLAQAVSGPQGSPQAAFVTQSDGLRDAARKAVRCVVRLRDDQSPENVVSADRFLTFYEFCLNRLSESDQRRFADRTAAGGYVSPARFRELLLGHGENGFRGHLPANVSAELTWFVVRSYIKGYVFNEGNADEAWLDPDSYQEVARDDHVVSNETYHWVWENVWPWYKRLTVPTQENRKRPTLWDDQDLARQVLRCGRSDAPQYAALFCDEAQDFTRLEMAVLLKALAWSQYNLVRTWQQRALHLPVVLAGDPYQTINPSGFRWEGVKESLEHVLEEALLVPERLRVTHRELQYNYRNLRSIARVANAIQFARKTLLGYRCQPQRLWRTDDGELGVRCLYLGRDVSLQHVLDSGAVVVVPLDPASAEIGQLLGAADTEEIKQHENVMSTALVKGLEYSKVVVMGFGAYLASLGIRDLWSWRNARDRDDIPEGERLEVEYFFNRLYVAVTRATDELFVVDTDQGFAALWEPLRKLADTESAGSEWAHECATDYTQGRPEELLERHPEVLAQAFEREAHRSRDPELARRAVFYYERAQMPIEANEMRAYADYWRGSPQSVVQAAERMRDEVRKPDLAAQWFWEARQWSELAQAGWLPDSLTWKRRRRIAELMADAGSPRTAHWLDALLQEVEDEAQYTNLPRGMGPDRAPWGELLATLLREAQPIAPRQPRERAARWFTFLAALEDRYELDRVQLATLAFWAGRMETAINLFELAGAVDKPLYYEAKAHTTIYPEALKWWQQAQRPERVLDLFDRRGGDWLSLGDDDRERVARACEQQKRVADAFVYLACLNPTDAFRVWNVHFNQAPDSDAQLAECLARVYDLMARDPRTQQLDSRFAACVVEILLQFAKRDVESSGRLDQDRSEWRTLAASLAERVPGERVRERFLRLWDGGKGGIWPTARQLLPILVQIAGYAVRSSLEEGQPDAARRWAEWALDLVWKRVHDRGERAAGGVGTSSKPLPRAALVEYLLAPPADSRTREKPGSACEVLGLELLDDWACIVVLESLKTVTAGPPDWLQAREFEKEWKALCERVRRVSEALLDAVRTRMTGLREISDQEASYWEEAGHFIERSVRRAQAVDFFRALSNYCDQVGCPARLADWAQRQLDEAPTEHQRFEEGRRLPTAVELTRGRKWCGTQTEVRVSDSRPELLVEYLPEWKRTRFRWDTQQFDFDRGVVVAPEASGPGGATSWIIRYRDWDTRLQWDPARSELVLETEGQRLVVRVSR